MNGPVPTLHAVLPGRQLAIEHHRVARGRLLVNRGCPVVGRLVVVLQHEVEAIAFHGKQHGSAQLQTDARIAFGAQRGSDVAPPAYGVSVAGAHAQGTLQRFPVVVGGQTPSLGCGNDGFLIAQEIAISVEIFKRVGVKEHT